MIRKTLFVSLLMFLVLSMTSCLGANIPEFTTPDFTNDIQLTTPILTDLPSTTETITNNLTSDGSVTTDTPTTDTITTDSLTVVFNVNGGTPIISQSVSNGDTLSPVSTNKNGYTFDQWYEDDLFTIAFDISSPITSSMILYAKWIPVSYNVFLHLSEYEMLESQLDIEFVANDLNQHVYTSKLAFLEGWYIDPLLTIPLSKNNISNNMHIYANYSDHYDLIYYEPSAISVDGFSNDLNYLLSEDGEIYYKFGNAYNAYLNNNFSTYFNVQSLFQLKQGEVITEIVDSSSTEIIFKSSENKYYLAGYSLAYLLGYTTSNMDKMTLSFEIASLLNFEDDEIILSTFCQINYVLIQTNKRIIGVGAVPVLYSSTNLGPFDLTNTFDLGVGEYFQKNNQDITHTSKYVSTNQRIFLSNVVTSSSFDNYDENAPFFDLSSLIPNDDFRYIYSSRRGDYYTFITKNGLVISNDNPTPISLSLNSNETIEKVHLFASVIILTSEGRLLRLDENFQTSDFLEDTPMEGKIIEDIFNLGYHMMIYTSENDFYIENPFSHLTNISTELSLNNITFQDFYIRSNLSGFSEALIFSNQQFFELYDNIIQPYHMYGLNIHERVILSPQDTLSLRTCDVNPFYANAWMNLNYMSYDISTMTSGSHILVPQFSIPPQLELYYQFVDEDQSIIETIGWSKHIGNQLTLDEILDRIPYGYEYVSTTLDGQAFSFPNIVSQSMAQKTLIISTSQLPTITATINYQNEEGLIINSSSHEIVVGDSLSDNYTPLQDNYYYVEAFYLDSAFTTPYNSDEPIAANITIYGKLVRYPTYTLTIVSEDYDDIDLDFRENVIVNLTDLYNFLSNQYSLSVNQTIRGFYLDANFTQQVPSYFEIVQEMTLYIMISDILSSSITFMDEDQNILFIENVDIHINMSVDQSLANILAFTSGHEIEHMYHDTNLSQEILPTDLITNNHFPNYIILSAIEEYTVNIHYIDGTNFSILETIEETVFENESQALQDILDDINNNTNYFMEGIYLDQNLTNPLNISQITEDIDLYVATYESGAAQITLIFNQLDIPNYSYYIRNINSIGHYDVLNYVRSYVSKNISNIKLYTNPQMTDEYIFDTPLYYDRTFYVDFDYTDPVALTIVSSNQLFDDLVFPIFSNYELYPYSLEDLYETFIKSFVHEDIILDYQFYTDPGLTNLYSQQNFSADTILYLDLSLDSHISIDVTYSGLINDTVTFLHPELTIFSNDTILNFARKHFGAYSISSNSYSDAALQTPYTQTTLTDGTSLYSDVSLQDAKIGFLILFLLDGEYMIISDYPLAYGENNLYPSYTLHQNMFSYLLRGQGYDDNTYDVSYYEDKNMTIPVTQSTFYESKLFYAEIKPKALVPLHVQYTIDGENHDYVIEMFSGQKINYSNISNALSAYMDNALITRFDAYSDELKTIDFIWYSYITEETTLYLDFTSIDIENPFSITFTSNNPTIAPIDIGFDEEVDYETLIHNFYTYHLSMVLDLDLIDYIGFYQDSNLQYPIESDGLFISSSDIYVDISLKTYHTLDMTFIGDGQGSLTYIIGDNKSFDQSILYYHLSSSGISNPTWSIYQDINLTTPLDLTSVTADQMAYVDVKENLTKTLTINFIEYNQFITSIDFNYSYAFDLSHIKDILLTNLQLNYGSYDVLLYTDSALTNEHSTYEFSENINVYGKVVMRDSLDIQFNYLIMSPKSFYPQNMTVYLGETINDSFDTYLLKKYLSDNGIDTSEMTLSFYEDNNCQTPISSVSQLTDQMMVYIKIDIGKSYMSSILDIRISFPQDNINGKQYYIEQAMLGEDIIKTIKADISNHLVDESLIDQFMFYTDSDLTIPFNEHMFYYFFADFYLYINLGTLDLSRLYLEYIAPNNLHRDSVFYLFDDSDTSSIQKALDNYASKHPYLEGVFTQTPYITEYKITPYTDEEPYDNMTLYVHMDYIGQANYTINFHFLDGLDTTMSEVYLPGTIVDQDFIFNNVNLLFPNVEIIKTKLYRDANLSLPYLNTPIFADQDIYVLVQYHSETYLNNYFATGQFAGWADAVEKTSPYLMETISMHDPRVSSIKTSLEGASLIKIMEIRLKNEWPGWQENFTINGQNYIFSGALSAKVIEMRQNNYDPRYAEFWAQDKLSGPVHNLTPETFFIPRYIETNEFGDGSYYSNSYAFDYGTYDLVFAIIDGNYYMGLIAK